ncbi:hypothetical protein [Methyloceanibacter superfactus]|uniref:hypothetical protein n=1 Tax=Methyloceanibacter superfactus TaxID=1774969 RepID=UPI00313A2069
MAMVVVLPAPFAEKRHGRAGLDRKTYVIDGGDGAISLGEAAHHHGQARKIGAVAVFPL